MNLARKAFFKFLRSPGFKKAAQKLSKANHNLELEVPSPIHTTPRKIFFGPKKLGKKLRLSMISGGLGGRIFEINYVIGKHANYGAGRFLFRADYWDYRPMPDPPVFGPHFHVGWEAFHNPNRHNSFR